MTIVNQNVKINRGDSVTLFVALTQADGTPFDPTLNAVMKYRLLNNAYDDEAMSLVRKDLGSGMVNVTTPSNGVNISLLAIDTAQLFPGYFYHQLTVWDGADTETAMTGLVIVKGVVQMVKADLVIPLQGNLTLSPTKPTKTP